MRPRARRPALAVTALVALALAVWLTPAQASRGSLPGPVKAAAAASGPVPRPAYVPRIRHVFVINIENKGYVETFGDGSAAPYLAGRLRRKGVLLNHYYATAHNSLPNYLAQISGQAPTLQGQLDCQIFSAFTRTGPDQAPGQKVGTGCVYPRGVRTLPRQLTHNGLTWRGYMQQMERPCQHPRVGAADTTQHATPGHNYAVRHDPFMYFRSIIGSPRYCRLHVRNLEQSLPHDLEHVRTTRNLTYITPGLCRDGHDDPCANGKPGGLVQVNGFLKRWVPRILKSPAYRRNGMLVITADEADGFTDKSTCCGETPGPNVAQAGIIVPSGGRVGALVLSRFTRRNTWSTTPYNHYSLLASLEEIFGLPKLGMARVDGLPVFGLDVYNNGWWNR